MSSQDNVHNHDKRILGNNSAGQHKGGEGTGSKQSSMADLLKKPANKVSIFSTSSENHEVNANMKRGGSVLDEKNRERAFSLADRESQVAHNSKTDINMLQKIPPRKMSSLRGRHNAAGDNPYVKIKRCLNTALYCTKMSNIAEKIRLLGTSSIHYSPIFKNRQYILSKLKEDKVSKQVVKLPWYIINPESKFYMAWTMVGFIFILYAITYMPYGLIFVESDFVNALEDYMNYYFMVDVVVNFITAIYVNEE